MKGVWSVVSIDCAGSPVYDDSGELVCVQPFPSMPTHFWNDPDGVKYKKAYFNRIPGEEILWTRHCCNVVHSSSSWICRGGGEGISANAFF